MERFKVLKQLGEGSFGEVTLCEDRESFENVAVKVLTNKNYSTWEECLKLREVRALRKLGKHSNVVCLRQIIRQDKKLYMIFDFHPSNLYKRIQKQKSNRSGFRSDLLMKWSHQLLSALAHIHMHGYFHRDIKPENILIDKHDCIQLCDFGLAREIRSRPPYTAYVSTRWYRAPELVLRFETYNSPVDIWAAACVLVELHTLKPLFPAKGTLDHILRICSYLGPINIKTWSEGYAKATTNKAIKLPTTPATYSIVGLLSRFCTCKKYTTLIKNMLSLDPKRRPAAVTCLGSISLTNSNTHNDPTPEDKKTVSIPVSETNMASFSRTEQKQKNETKKSYIPLSVDNTDPLTIEVQEPQIGSKQKKSKQCYSPVSADKLDALTKEAEELLSFTSLGEELSSPSPISPVEYEGRGSNDRPEQQSASAPVTPLQFKQLNIPVAKKAEEIKRKSAEEYLRGLENDDEEDASTHIDENLREKEICSQDDESERNNNEYLAGLEVEEEEENLRHQFAKKSCSNKGDIRNQYAIDIDMRRSNLSETNDRLEASSSHNNICEQSLLDFQKQHHEEKIHNKSKQNLQCDNYTVAENKPNNEIHAFNDGVLSYNITGTSSSSPDRHISAKELLFEEDQQEESKAVSSHCQVKSDDNKTEFVDIIASKPLKEKKELLENKKRTVFDTAAEVLDVEDLSGDELEVEDFGFNKNLGKTSLNTSVLEELGSKDLGNVPSNETSKLASGENNNIMKISNPRLCADKNDATFDDNAEFDSYDRLDLLAEIHKLRQLLNKETQNSARLKAELKREREKGKKIISILID